MKVNISQGAEDARKELLHHPGQKVCQYADGRKAHAAVSHGRYVASGKKKINMPFAAFPILKLVWSEEMLLCFCPIERERERIEGGGIA